MVPGHSKVEDFIRRYERLARSKVWGFLSRNFRADAPWLQEDLMQAAMCGVISAHKMFDPARGIPEPIYVAIRIDHAILQEFDRLSPTSSENIAMLRRIQKDRQLLEGLFHRPVTHSELADFLSMTDDELGDALQKSVSHVLLTEETEQTSTDDEISVDHGAAMLEVWGELSKILSELSPRDRKIIDLLFFEGLSTTEAGKRLGFSRQHVSLLRKQILEKLRTDLARFHDVL